MRRHTTRRAHTALRRCHHTTAPQGSKSDTVGAESYQLSLANRRRILVRWASLCHLTTSASNESPPRLSPHLSLDTSPRAPGRLPAPVRTVRGVVLEASAPRDASTASGTLARPMKYISLTYAHHS